MHEFNTKKEAYEWMEQQVDDPSTDNFRFAFLDDKDALMKYEKIKGGGCCGFFDEEITIKGRKAAIGCNYGH